MLERIANLHRFQIQSASFLPGAEDRPEQMLYCTGDFLLDDFCRFFSAVSVPVGRGERGRSSR
jgi:hypothetical protein